jgi:hypothetical protein
MARTVAVSVAGGMTRMGEVNTPIPTGFVGLVLLVDGPVLYAGDPAAA